MNNYAFKRPCSLKLHAFFPITCFYSSAVNCCCSKNNKHILISKLNLGRRDEKIQDTENYEVKWPAASTVPSTPLLARELNHYFVLALVVMGGEDFLMLFSRGERKIRQILILNIKYICQLVITSSSRRLPLQPNSSAQINNFNLR